MDDPAETAHVPEEQEVILEHHVVAHCPVLELRGEVCRVGGQGLDPVLVDEDESVVVDELPFVDGFHMHKVHPVRVAVHVPRLVKAADEVACVPVQLQILQEVRVRAALHAHEFYALCHFFCQIIFQDDFSDEVGVRKKVPGALP